jgi:ribose/xylose/arabinose/galactoside ABC-type transport system permease subunit
MLRGLALALASGTQVTGLPLSDPFFAFLGGTKYAGVPVSVLLLIVAAIVLTLVMRNTPFGYRVRQIGSNPDAAAFSGIPVRRTRTWGFVLAGFMAGLAGIVALAFSPLVTLKVAEASSCLPSLALSLEAPHLRAARLQCSGRSSARSCSRPWPLAWSISRYPQLGRSSQQAR